MKIRSIIKLIRLVSILSFLFMSKSNAQESISAAQWQEDLRYLQKTVHSKFPQLFKKISAADFDTEVEKLYKEIPNLEAHEVPAGLARMVSLFEYGHSQITFGTVAQDKILPINLYQFSDGVYIEGAHKDYQKAIGARVVAIEGIPIEKVFRMIRPVVPVENDQYFKAYGVRFATLPTVLHAQGVTEELKSTIEFTLEKNGKRFKQTIKSVELKEMSTDYCLTIPNEQWESARSQAVTPLYLKDLNEKFYFFEYLADSKVLYVRQSSVFNDEKESLADFYKRLFEFIDTNEIEKLVYDCRLNGGGNNYNNKAFIKGIMARPKVNTKGKFFYIIGRNTFSAAQNLTNEIENYTEAIIVGEPTAENKNFYGDARRVTLPNSRINAYLSYAWWQDVPQWENKDWTIPNIAVDMSFDQYSKNEDPILEAALKYTDTGFILNPLDHLTQLFLAGKYGEVKQAAKEIASNPQYKYYDFEKEFGQAGNRLFENGNVQGGLFVLELITEVYPKSASALYSLGYAQEQSKQLEAAKKSYQAIIDIDSKSTLAKAAKGRIDSLNNK
ncbi:tetratricopeptide repeat protein [Spongiivirga citrea]|uniref:Uncharacterized protein n=1 Tax=Spongiivirga citrea TaxID=1481457 RepID=A0A6M0CKQ7_9FLAO|nr:tetratricopeptide repeat protein [Spongiivirga citrea]NER16554.1 hypothetical protein [Spongiivirga citrea]